MIFQSVNPTYRATWFPLMLAHVRGDAPRFFGFVAFTGESCCPRSCFPTSPGLKASGWRSRRRWRRRDGGPTWWVFSEAVAYGALDRSMGDLRRFLLMKIGFMVDEWSFNGWYMVDKWLMNDWWMVCYQLEVAADVEIWLIGDQLEEWQYIFFTREVMIYESNTGQRSSAVLGIHWVSYFHSWGLIVINRWMRAQSQNSARRCSPKWIRWPWTNIERDLGETSTALENSFSWTFRTLDGNWGNFKPCLVRHCPSICFSGTWMNIQIIGCWWWEFNQPPGDLPSGGGQPLPFLKPNHFFWGGHG